jgi:hypothetical protein
MGADDFEEHTLRQNEHLKNALKSYNRKKTIRGIVFWIAFAVAAIVPSWLELTTTNHFIWFVAMFGAVLFEQRRKHIRAMQVRLTIMSDRLDHLAGEDVPELSEAYGTEDRLREKETKYACRAPRGC